MRENVGRRSVGQFLLPILEENSRQIRKADVAQPNEFERFLRGIEVSIDFVGEENEEWNVGMIFSKRSRQHARERQMPLGRNRRRCHLAHGNRRRNSRYFFATRLSRMFLP